MFPSSHFTLTEYRTDKEYNMDNIILLVLCVCGGILAASQQRIYYDEEILTEIRQSLRDELKAEIQELMGRNKAMERDEPSRTNNILLEEITILRNEMDMLKSEVTFLKRDLGDKTKKMITLQDETVNRNIRMVALEEEMVAARREVHILKEEMKTNMIDGQGKDLGDSRTDEAEDKTDNMVQPTEAASGVVAFSASRTTDLGPVSVDTTITYDVLELSFGGGIVPSTGTFTAPVTGLYLLHMGMQGDNVMVDYYINQDKYRNVKTATAPSPYNTAATVAIVQLAAGDMVTAELDVDYGSAHIRCGTSGACYMGGYLLHETI